MSRTLFTPHTSISQPQNISPKTKPPAPVGLGRIDLTALDGHVMVWGIEQCYFTLDAPLSVADTITTALEHTNDHKQIIVACRSPDTLPKCNDDIWKAYDTIFILRPGQVHDIICPNDNSVWKKCATPKAYSPANNTPLSPVVAHRQAHTSTNIAPSFAPAKPYMPVKIVHDQDYISEYIQILNIRKISKTTFLTDELAQQAWLRLAANGERAPSSVISAIIQDIAKDNTQPLNTNDVLSFIEKTSKYDQNVYAVRQLTNAIKKYTNYAQDIEQIVLTLVNDINKDPDQYDLTTVVQDLPTNSFTPQMFANIAHHIEIYQRKQLREKLEEWHPAHDWSCVHPTH